MEEKDKELNGIAENITDELPIGYVEDNNLKIFLDDTIDLGEVVSEIEDSLIKENTDEINLDE